MGSKKQADKFPVAGAAATYGDSTDRQAHRHALQTVSDVHVVMYKSEKISTQVVCTDSVDSSMMMIEPSGTTQAHMQPLTHIIDVGGVGVSIPLLVAVVDDEVDGQQREQQQNQHVHYDAGQVHSQTN